MPSIWKKLSSHPKVEPFQFPRAEELMEPEQVPEEESAPPPPPAPPQEETDFAQELREAQEKVAEEALQQSAARAAEEIARQREEAEQVLRDAEAQAQNILDEAHAEAELLRENARTQGLEEGRQQGEEEGRQQALEEQRQQTEQELQALTDEVEQFLSKANDELDKMLDDSVSELRDLAIAVAEKVIGISLESSSEVIERMIRMAVDKRKRREWAQIYVSQKDAKRLMPLSPMLTGALAALAGRVRIIPMGDDEKGVCIIETPDEIIDASVSTQLDNIRNTLADVPADDPSAETQERFTHVSEYDPAGAALRQLQSDR